MNVVNLVVACALLAGLWAVVLGALAASVRRDDLAQEALARLAAKGASWRSLPENRVLPKLPTCPGPANVCTTTGISPLTMKNLRV